MDSSVLGMSKFFYLFCFFYITVSFDIISARCSDEREPIFPNPKLLEFCGEYSEYSCCTYKDDQKLFLEYKKLLSDFKTDDKFCKDSLKDILCLKCSPESSVSYYDGRPNLCFDYCQNFTKTCGKFNFGDLCGLNYENCYPKDYESLSAFSRNRRSSENVECLCLKEFASKLRNPIIFQSTKQKPPRIYVGEQIGIIHVYDQNGTKFPAPFLDIRKQVHTVDSPGDERGLLAAVFHPGFTGNKRFFVMYSVPNGSTRISEFSISKKYPDRADINSEKILFEFKQPYKNHNGGALLFGDDGFLYITLADGGGKGDPNNNAQNLNIMLGKVLRINVDIGENIPYGIPPDNPYDKNPKAKSEIFAYGVRNMWRCSMDRGNHLSGRNRGRIFCSDTGEDRYEEVNIIERGGNYGWNIKEGNKCFRQGCTTPLENEVPPIFEYNRTIGFAVSGGYVYRGCEIPFLEGRYIFGDYGKGTLFELTEDELNSKWNLKKAKLCNEKICSSKKYTSTFEKYIIGFGEDEFGELYMMTTDNAHFNKSVGKVYKIVNPNRLGDASECINPKGWSSDAVQMYYCQGSLMMSLIICLLIFI